MNNNNYKNLFENAICTTGKSYEKIKYFKNLRNNDYKLLAVQCKILFTKELIFQISMVIIRT